METAILKVKLAETYLKIKQEYNEENIISIRNSLVRAAEEELTLNRRIRRIDSFTNDNDAIGDDSKRPYDSNITCVISIEEGSIKGRVTFFGVLAFIYHGIGSYGDFRSGLAQLKEDAVETSENIINRTKADNSVVNENIERSERRTGIVGRLSRTLDRMDLLQNQLPALSNEQVQEELIRLRQDLANIIQLLPAEERNAILEALPPVTKNNLPQPNPEEMEHFRNLYALKPEDLEGESFSFEIR